MKKAVIWSPSYFRKSAGIVACHMMCGELRKRGVETYIQSILGPWQPSPYDAPAVTGINQYDAELRYAHIYPECLFDAIVGITQMPIRNTHTYWWMLSPRVPVKENDLPKMYWDYTFGTNKEEELLACDVMSKDFYPSSQENRRGIAVYEGKGRIDYELVEKIRLQCAPGEDIYPITVHGSSTTAYNSGGLPDLFRKVRFTISFDGMTSAVAESVLCSTPVLLTMKNSFGMSSNSRMRMPGVCDDLLDLPKATQEAATAYDTWQVLRKQFDKETDRFASMLLS